MPLTDDVVGKTITAGDNRRRERLTHQQFDRAAMDTRLSKLSALAARFVLVDGMSQTGAARKVGIKHRQQVSRAVSCIRKAAMAEGVCAVCGSRIQHADGTGRV